MDELFNIIGKLYVDIHNMQKYIEVLQGKLKEQEQELSSLKSVSTPNFSNKTLDE